MKDVEIKAGDIERYRSRVAKGGRVVSILLLAASALLLVSWLVPLVLFMAKPVLPEGFRVFVQGSAVNTFGAMLQGLLCVSVLWFVIGICRGAFRDLSPFSTTQVTRIRLLALSLLLLALVDFSFGPGGITASYNGSMFVGFTSNSERGAINFVAIVASGALFFLSFVFKYGAMLQSVSDDTV